jgi:CubicO group peptidase (beta-lactamase class C family)
MKNALFAFLLFLTALAGTAQENGSIKKINGSKISGAALTLDLQKIVDTSRIMGLSVVIINDGRQVYKKTFGLRSKATNAVLNDTTEMYAASLTKPVSAYLFLKLVDKGIFSLDTPIHRYLKNPIGSYEKWADLKSDKAFEKITPRMILSHSSGLPIMRFLYGDKVNLIAEPGTKFYYSNEGMNLLGFTVEEYTGKKLEDLASELVFKPLLMQNTSMIWLPAFDADYALGYDRKGEVIGISKRSTAKAAGSMTTTASDYAKFVATVMEKKGLDKKLFEDMFKPQVKIISKKGFGPERDSLSNKYNKIALSWGLGLGLFQSADGKAFFHAGHDDGWQNYFVAYPGKNIAVVLMSNSSNFEPVAAKILNLCIGDSSSALEWLGYYDNN